MDFAILWTFMAGFSYTALIFGVVYFLLRDQTKEIKEEFKKLQESLLKDKNQK